MHPPIRVVHTADLHLGAPFRSLPEQADRLREEQLTLLARLVTFCAERQAGILLIAGDLFDHPHPPVQVVRTAAELFGSIPETRIFIAAGNHDPAFIDSPYRSHPWPANVRLFTDSFEGVDLPELPVRVHGAGFTATAMATSLLPLQPQPARPDRLNLLVLHGDLVTRGQGSAYNPVSLDQLSALGMHYTALGHRHDATAPIPAGSGSVAYSGCPMGRGFDEAGPKSVRLLEFMPAENGSGRMAGGWSCRSETVGLGGRVFQERVIGVAGCTTHEAVADRVRTQLAADDPLNWTGNLYRILLCGALAEGFAIMPTLLRQQLARDAFHIEIVDETERQIDLAALSREVSLRGTFVRMLAARLETANRLGREDEAATVRLALTFGLGAFSGEVALHADS